MLTETQVYITLSNELYYNYYRLCFCCCCVVEHIKYNFIYLKKHFLLWAHFVFDGQR